MVDAETGTAHRVNIPPRYLAPTVTEPRVASGLRAVVRHLPVQTRKRDKLTGMLKLVC